ncbi:hypothetical protein [Aeoliella sp.]|uniref:hypothetical protein n=1 Tax=Aeoliella sp. TaxID=2795800 RepID=UPI003CCC067E
MTVTFRNELPGSPELTHNTGIEETSITVRRRFSLYSDSINDGPAEVLSNASIPAAREYYQYGGTEQHTLLKVISRTATRQEKNALEWIVEVDYETADYDDDWSNPLNDPVEIVMSTEKEQVTAFWAVNSSGVPTTVFLTSAGEALENYPTKQKSWAVLEFTRNEALATNVIALANTYIDATNADTFWTATAGQVRCDDIGVERMVKQLPDGTDFPYLKIKYRFAFRDSWLLSYLDKGSYYLYPIGVGSSTRKFKTEDGNPAIGNLDGTGYPDTEPAILGPFNIYKTATFGTLSLPTSFAS